MVVQSINLVADLRHQNQNIGVLYIATGLVTGGDNNGGVFWWNPSSTAADDGVDVIQVIGTTTGRWIRITDNNNSVPSSRTLTINGTTFDLSANRTYNVGTVTNVSFALGASGTDLNSVVTNSTTTPSITLNVPTASATNRGVLSAADWTMFNGKQSFLGGTGLVKSVAGVISYITDNSSNWNTAYNDSIISAAVTGTNTKTLTLNQQDGGTVTASWSDIDTGLTSVGLSMPSAFTVTNSPLTSNGTIAITGSGNTLQYVDGTGALQTFPLLTGYVPYTGATANVNLGIYNLTAASLIKNGGTSGQFLKADGSVDSSAYIVLGSLSATAPLSYNNTTGVFTISQSGASTNGYLSSTDWNTFNNKQATITLTTTGSSGASTLIGNTLNIPNYANLVTSVFGRIGAVVATEGDYSLTQLSDVTITTPSNGQVLKYNGTAWVNDIDTDTGITSLNGLTALTQTFAVGTSGTDFAISSVTSTHTFNLPTASVSNRGALSSADWTTFNSKEPAIAAGTTLQYYRGDKTFQTLNTTVVPEGTNLYYLDSRARTAISLTTTGSSGASTYNSTTGVFNIPDYGSALTGYVPTSRQLTINGTAYDLSADRSWSVGTVTTVSFTLGSSGTNLNSVVTNSTTTPAITLNVPTASAANRGALSAADWSTFNTKVGGVTATTPLFSSGGSTPNLTIQQSSGSQAGYLSSTDWTTFNNKQAAGNYITSLTGEATATGPGAAAVTLDNAAVTAKILTGVNITGGTILSTDSILTGFGKLQNQVNGLIGGSIYQGTWNASTNTPTLTSSVGTAGYYYIVSVAGNTNLNGITDWQVGDWAIFNGGVWQKVDNTDSVISVNGQTGAVSLTTDNISEGVTNLYYTDTRARAALSFVAGSGAYNSSTGAITIPTNTSQLTNGANFITLASLSGTAPISYNSGTGAISITQAGTASNGYLSSTDWNTFNNKQATLSLTTTGTSGAATLVGATLNIPQYADQFVGTVTSVAALTIGTTGTDLSSTVANGTTTPVITLNVPTASATNRGALSSADWTTFNNKQNTITNPVTGTGTTNYIPKWTSGSALGNSNLINDASGNLGLGVTPSAWAVNRAMDIASNGAFFGDGAIYDFSTGIGQNCYRTGNTTWAYKLGVAAARFELNNNNFYWYNAPTGTAGNAITFTQAMTLTAAGRLLLGTTTESSFLLDVNGTARVSDAVTFGNDINLTRAVSPAIVSTANQNIRFATNGFEAVLDTTGRFRSAVGFRTDGFVQSVNLAVGASYYNTAAPTNGAIIQGNVGIGAVSPQATYKVTISGTDTIFPAIYLENTTNTQAYSIRATGTNFVVRDNTSGNDRLTIASTGAATFSSSVTGAAASFTTGAFSGNLTCTGVGFANTGIKVGLSATSGLSSKIQYTDGATYNWTAGGTGAGDFAISYGEYATVVGTVALKLTQTGAATFSNALQVGGQQAAANYGGTGLNFDFTNGNIGRIASVKTTSGGSQLQFFVYNTSGADINALTIASTGAATFSSSVTATSLGINVAPISDRVLYLSGNLATTGASQFQSVMNGTVVNAATTIYGMYVGNNSNVNVTNSYAIYIENTGGSGTITNKYGIYQASSGDRNYFAGNLLVGTTTDSGEKLVVSGSAKVSGKLIVNHSSTDYIAEFINTSSSTPYGVIIKDAASAANNYPLFHIVNNGATVEYFRVNSGTGSASFSSSVTASESFISNVVNGYALILNRSAVTNYNGINHRTAGSAKWFVGMRENLSSNNYIIYNEVNGADTLTLNTTTNAATFSSTIQTAAPTGYSAQPWKLGDATSGTLTPNYYIKVEINGQIYSIPALQGTP